MPERSIEELIEVSSLGTPEAKALRAQTSDERVAKVLARAQEIEAGCTMTHGEHLATWKSWRDDCAGCGFGMQDVDQCDRGHPDDGVTFCGACGWDTVYNQLKPGELTAICVKALTAGSDISEWTVGRVIREFPLTEAEAALVARERAETIARARSRWTPEQRARVDRA